MTWQTFSNTDYTESCVPDCASLNAHRMIPDFVEPKRNLMFITTFQQNHPSTHLLTNHALHAAVLIVQPLVISSFVRMIEHHIALAALQFRRVILHVRLQSILRPASFTANFAFNLTGSAKTQVKHLGVVILPGRITVPTVAIVTLNRLGMHLHVTVQTPHSIDDDRFHDALLAREWNFVNVGRKVFQ